MDTARTFPVEIIMVVHERGSEQRHDQDEVPENYKCGENAKAADSGGVGKARRHEAEDGRSRRHEQGATSTTVGPSRACFAIKLNVYTRSACKERIKRDEHLPL